MAPMQFVDCITVRALSATSTRGCLAFGAQAVPCILGRGGISHDKREGDGASPAGAYAMRRAYYRADRMMRPRTVLPLRALRHDDGWCDDPASVCYNRLIRHPFAGSAERLWRTDELYDLIVVLGHNDAPVVRGRGSAIFLHVAGLGQAPTQGCIAVARDDLARLVGRIGHHTRLIIA